MGLVRPELLLLLVPALWIWWRTRDAALATRIVRLLLMLLLIVALAAPYLQLSEDGRDLVIVVDRSRSMPRESGETARELIRLAEEARVTGDRLSVLSFGGRAAIESLPSASATFDGFARAVDADASRVSDALDAALNLIPEGRNGSILLVSDGENQGRDPTGAARRSFARGIRIDVRPVSRPPVADLAVERLDLPDDVAVGEPFQFSAWIHADTRTETEFVLRRDGVELSRGRRQLAVGLNQLLFRDVLGVGGVAEYTLELESGSDRILENNRGLGAVEARGTKPILVLNHDGTEDTLVRALRLARIPVVVSAPEELRLDPLALFAWRAVILENVSAPRIGRRGMDALADWVRERGGGLMMTGGKGSFGVGGYHLTPIDEILPVSMELRQEHRKQGVALSIVLDRSGSMGQTVGGSMTKMDLANLGAAAAIELLSMIDSVGVIAVDSQPHVVQPLTPVAATAELVARVKTIQASGGGIYCRTGLVAAARMLDGAPQLNRHVVLFADAADAEEQAGCLELIDQLGEMGTTVSVIALGTDMDSDARFLESVAARGEGEVYFTTEPQELPRLFAQDTLMVARSTFVEETTSVRVLPDLFGLGEVELTDLPALPGYNLNYLREGAAAGAVTLDEYSAPILAHTYRGLGRTAAYCGQIGGSFGGPLVSWPGFSSMFVTVARWLAGQETPSDLFPTVRREGAAAIVSVEVDPEATVPPDTSGLVVRVADPAGEITEHPLERVGENLFEARISLAAAGVTLGTLRLPDGRFENLPPILLSYSPEFERSPDPEAGERLLRSLARDTGGEVAPAAHTLFRGDRQADAYRVVSRELVLAAILLLLVEIAARRLGLWALFADLWKRLRRARAKTPVATAAGASSSAAAPSASTLRAARVADGSEAEPSRPAPASGPEAEPKKRAGSVVSALTRARRSAGRKIDR